MYSSVINFCLELLGFGQVRVVLADIANNNYYSLGIFLMAGLIQQKITLLFSAPALSNL